MNIIARISCFFRGHIGTSVEAPCERCDAYLSYLDVAAKSLHESLPRRIQLRWYEFRRWRERQRKWRRAANKPCLQCGKCRRGCDDCIPF